VRQPCARPTRPLFYAPVFPFLLAHDTTHHVRHHLREVPDLLPWMTDSSRVAWTMPATRGLAEILAIRGDRCVSVAACAVIAGIIRGVARLVLACLLLRLSWYAVERKHLSKLGRTDLLESA
jgi:hypothetical protein